MSSPPEPRTFEGWIEEDWPGATKRADVMALLEPYREAVTLALDDFEEEEQSWRDYCGRIYGWGDGPNDQGAVPDSAQKKVSEMMSAEPKPGAAAKDGEEAPDLDALRDRVAALEEALAEALGGWEGTVSDVGVTSYHTIKRLRVLAAGGAGKEPSR